MSGEISSAWARRPSGAALLVPPWGSSSFMGVATPPGQIAFTRTAGAYSTAATLVSATRAAFDAAYAP